MFLWPFLLMGGAVLVAIVLFVLARAWGLSFRRAPQEEVPAELRDVYQQLNEAENMLNADTAQARKLFRRVVRLLNSRNQGQTPDLDGRIQAGLERADRLDKQK